MFFYYNKRDLNRESVWDRAFLFFQKYFLKTPEIYLSKRPKKLYRWGAKIPGDSDARRSFTDHWKPNTFPADTLTIAAGDEPASERRDSDMGQIHANGSKQLPARDDRQWV